MAADNIQSPKQPKPKVDIWTQAKMKAAKPFPIPEIAAEPAKLKKPQGSKMRPKK